MLRQAAKTRRAQRQQISATASVPSPVGGWNARDPLAAMDPQDAVVLDNWFPRPSYCQMRPGFTDWATAIPGTVESLMSYSSGTVSTLFAVSNNAGTCAVYNANTQAAVGAAVLSGLTNARWQHVNFTTPGGSFLYMVNGADAPRTWNGTVWASPAITGIPVASTIVDLTVHKSRLYFVQINTLSIWYLPVNSVAGAAVEFPLGSIFRMGGAIASIGNWTIDAGNGSDDHLVIVTDQGEIAVYRGADPTAAVSWALVGVWAVGSPIGRRCLVKYAGDLLIVSRDGVLPMSEALQSTRVNSRLALTDKIQNAISAASTVYAATFGWEMELYPGEDALIVNVPTSATTSDQYIMNTISRAWCRFTGWQAKCWELHNDLMYFGTAGKVGLAWSGTSDAGVPITADVLPAFNYFGSRTQLKQWTMVRPTLSVDIVPSLQLGLNVDFDQTPTLGSPSFTPTAAVWVWDTALWDTAIWGGDGNIRKDWQTVSGLGYAASLRMRVTSATATTQWAAVDYLYQNGGVL